VADLNSVFLFARCRTKRDLAKVRRSLEKATTALEDAVRSDVSTLVGTLAERRIVAYSTCLDGLCSEDDLAPLVEAAASAEALDLYWVDAEGQACRFGGVLPWRREVNGLRALLDSAPETPAVLKPFVGEQGAATDTWRLRQPFTVEPRPSDDPARAVNLVVEAGDQREWVPGAWRPLVECLVKAAGTGRRVAAVLLSEHGNVGAIDVHSGTVRVTFDIESMLLEIIESAEDLRELRAGGRWTKRATRSAHATPKGGEQTPRDLNSAALAMWRGTKRLVDEPGAIVQFRQALSDAARLQDMRFERVVRRNLSALLAWRPDLRMQADPAQQTLGVHNVLCVYARYPTAAARDVGIQAIKAATESVFDQLHICNAPRVAAVAKTTVPEKGHVLLYRACLGQPCREEELAPWVAAVDGAQSRDLYWRDPESDVCRIEGALIAPIECVSGDWWVNSKRIEPAVLAALRHELEPIGLESGFARSKLPTPLVYEVPRGVVQRLHFVLSADGGLPEGFSASWLPVLDRFRSAIKVGREAGLDVRFNLCHRAGGNLATLVGVPGEASRLDLSWSDLHHDLLVQRRGSGQELDETGAWVEESDDIWLLHWRMAMGGDSGCEESLAMDLEDGRRGPIDEAAAAMWLRRALLRGPSNPSLLIRNFKNLLARRPDLRVPGDPE
jgi:hypothetical protein